MSCNSAQVDARIFQAVRSCPAGEPSTSTHNKHMTELHLFFIFAKLYYSGCGKILRLKYFKFVNIWDFYQYQWRSPL